MLKSKLINNNWSKIMHVLIAGGCAKAKEREVHDSCEILTLKVSENGDYHELSGQHFASLNRPRRGANLCKLNDNDYVILGGCSSENDHMNSAEIYDKIKNVWTLVPNVLTQGRSCFATSIQPPNFDVIHCLGGWNGLECLNSVDEIEIQKFNTSAYQPFNAERTDVDYDETTRNQLVLPLKNSCCVDVPSKNSFIIGGWDADRTLDTIFRYDSQLIDDKLLYVARLPYPVECHACVLYRNKFIFVIGGFDGITIRDDISVINVETLDVFTIPCKLARRRECLVAQIVGVDEYLIVAGGWDGYESLRSVELFKLSSDSDEIRVEPVEFYENLLKEPRNRACSIVFS